MAEGASLLTAARPGGVGKTTLMSALLAFLTPGERIRTVGFGASRIPRGNSYHGPECLLCHEIGNGAYFGYLWGNEVSVLLRAACRGMRVASNLHADTLEELTAQLTRPALGCAPEDIRRLHLLAFMAAVPDHRGLKRRVTRLYAAHQGAHRLLWRWNPDGDHFVWSAEDSEPEEFLSRGCPPYTRALDFLEGLAQTEERDYASVRRRVIEFLAPARAVDKSGFDL